MIILSVYPKIYPLVHMQMSKKCKNNGSLAKIRPINIGTVKCVGIS